MQKRWQRFLKPLLLALSTGSLWGCLPQALYAVFNPNSTPTPGENQLMYMAPQPEYAVPLYGAPQVKYGAPWSGTEAFAALPGFPQEALDGALQSPTGIALRSDGTIALSDTGKCVLLVNGTASDATASAIVAPVDLVTDGNDWLLADGNNILRLSNGTANPLGEGFSGPRGLAVASDSIFVSDSGHHQIKQIKDQTVTVVAGSTVGFEDGQSAKLNEPSGLALASDGTLYFCDTGNHAVRKWTPTGGIETVAGDGTAGFSGDGGNAKQARLNRPRSVALDATNRLYISDEGNHRIRVLDLNTGEIASMDEYAAPTWNGTSLLFPELKDVTFHNNYLYVLDGKKIWRAKP